MAKKSRSRITITKTGSVQIPMTDKIANTLLMVIQWRMNDLTDNIRRELLINCTKSIKRWQIDQPNKLSLKKLEYMVLTESETMRDLPTWLQAFLYAKIANF